MRDGATSSVRSPFGLVVVASLASLLTTLAPVERARAQATAPATPVGPTTPPSTTPPSTTPSPTTVLVEPTVPPGYTQTTVPHAAQPPPTFSAPTVVVPVPLAPPPPMQARQVEVQHSSSIRALWLPGLIALPVTWVSTWLPASTTLNEDAATYAWIPVIGPWLMLTQDVLGNEAAVIVSGVVQGVATICLVLGLSLRRTWTEIEYVVEPVRGVEARISFDVRGVAGGGLALAQLRM
jgi:hypothetical protein